MEVGQFGRSICHTATLCALTYCLPQRREERNIQMGDLSFDGAICGNLGNYIFKIRLKMLT